MTFNSTIRIFLLLAVVMSLSACSQDKKSMAAKYTAKSNDMEIVLNLKEDGRGTWSTDTDEISFKWSIRKGEQLWLHTREGGVIQGRLKGKRITLTLPGVDELVFSRQ